MFGGGGGRHVVLGSSQCGVRTIFGWGAKDKGDDSNSDSDGGDGDGKGKGDKKDEQTVVDVEGQNGGRAGHPAAGAGAGGADGEDGDSGGGDGDGDGDGADGGGVRGDPAGAAAHNALVSMLQGPPESLQDVLAVPVGRKPLFPGAVKQLVVTDDATVRAIRKHHATGRPHLGLFLKRDADAAEGGEGGEGVIADARNDVHQTGTLASIQNIEEVGADRGGPGLQLFVLAHRRVAITGDAVEEGPPPVVPIEHLPNGSDGDAADESESDRLAVSAYSNELLATLRDVIKNNPLFSEHVQYFSQHFDLKDPYRLADMAAGVLTAGTPEELQQLLEADGADKLNRVLGLLRREREITELQQQIRTNVEEKMSEQQRKYFLTEQLKMIQQELGIAQDDKEALLSRYQGRVDDIEKALATQQEAADAAAATEQEDGDGEEGEKGEDGGGEGEGALLMPEDAIRVINEEMDKLRTLEKNSSEFNVTRNYLDWLTLLPWGKCSEENFDVARARAILDEDHYGLTDVKERILEFIAVGNLRGSVQGKIICLSGPPGVGKTSIASSVARSLGREFFRFSVGGLTDVAEIKGHRRTYVGAMPGKLIQCLKATGASNPLVLIDEIDKLGRGHQGDPASALLELLDPNQNHAFTDHYLDVPVDLSKCLFLCTANVLDTIPGPLRDRMEVIELSGYDLQEKVQIARQYLDAKARAAAGLEVGGERTPSDLAVTDDAIEHLARWYCREAGVRNLEQHYEKIFRKVALEVVGGAAPAGGNWAIDAGNLAAYVGKPKFTSDRHYTTPPPGVVPGLAYTSLGGALLYIETKLIGRAGGGGGGDGDEFGDDGLDDDLGGGDSGDSISIGGLGGGGGGFRPPTVTATGQLGDVMRESSRIAAAVATDKVAAFAPGDSFFRGGPTVHLHVPEGATPKDGPSAGVTMATALVGLALNRPIRADLAMTGELTLTGKVLPVGGIREKVVAARRAGIACVVLPADNARDLDELPDYLKEDLEVHFASTFDDVFDIAFCEDRYFDI